jgi:dTDP-6-deoxy-L-talose 4-dehydrogenase (NAD+)
MRVAVTGATGFIGLRVLRELAKIDDVEVIAVARRPSSALEGARKSIRQIAFDVSSASGSDTFERLGSPDILIHLAWAGLPNYGSMHHFESHLSEQYQFLRSVIDGGLTSLTCTGTCFEYGMRSGELNESLTTDPQNPYGYAKDALRRQLELLRRNRPFELTWARLFYMYGQGQSAGSIYSQLIAAGIRGDKSFKMSKGEQLRDFLPVEEVAKSIVSLALNARDSGVVNVCSGHPVSIRSLVENWIEQHGFDLNLELGHFPYPNYEPMAFWGDATRLRQLLGSE